MQRETATHIEDLPHGFRPATALHAVESPPCEVCGYRLEHPLHGEHAVALERESHRQMIQTEKGS